MKRCPFGDSHVFKTYIHIPGTKNKRKTKKLNSRNIDEAIKEAMEFEREIKEGIVEVPNVLHMEVNKRMPEDNSPFLINGFARYIGVLNNENVPFHRQEEKSTDYIKDIERAFGFFLKSQKKYNINVGLLKADQLNDFMMGYFYKELLDNNFSPRTINKYLGHLTTFLSWHMQEFKVPERNWFATINREYEPPPDPQTITESEFERLIAESKKPGNGIQHYEHGSKLERNYERYFMPDVFSFGLYGGMRRENLLTAKFSDIKEENKIPITIKVPNLKVNRILNLTKQETIRHIDVPVTNELRELLYSLGYEKFKDSDNYIIAPEIESNRTRALSDLITRAFSHYYSKLNTGRILTFKNLRKTYATSMALQYGDDIARIIIGHSLGTVLDKHYRNREVIAKEVAKTFRGVFQDKRKIELEQIRNNSKQNQLEMEVEK
ncbi:MAG TPA: hypothetical protein VJY62_09105 [Bacteroidia bacterium]|nr:hypothetical protein [Bacteroidia bacterium]